MPLTILAAAIWIVLAVPAGAQSTGKKSTATASASGQKPGVAVKKAAAAGPSAQARARPVKPVASTKPSSVKAKPVAKKPVASAKAKPAAKTATKAVAKGSSTTKGKKPTTVVSSKAATKKTPATPAGAKAKATKPAVAKTGTGATKKANPGTSKKPATAARDGVAEASGRTPSPPAKLNRSEAVAPARASARSGGTEPRATGTVASGGGVARGEKPGQSEPPFSPDDDELDPDPELAAVDEAAAPEGVEALDAEGRPLPGIAQVAQVETPMLMVLAMAGGAGAATTNAEGRPVAAPVAAPDSSPELSANSAIPDLAATALPSPPEPTKRRAPLAMETPPSIAPPPPKARATITSLTPLTGPASPKPPAVPTSAVPTSLNHAAPEARGEDTSPPSLAVPSDPDPVPLEPVTEMETVSMPDRLELPPAPDELPPQRAERQGPAFEVPAAVGDLLIAANAQTDFQMDQKRIVFRGNVIMKNERFYLTADTLVAYMKDDHSGLEFAEAQGNVVVRMVENDRETGSSGLAKTAVFHPETGEIVLKGWPQLRMGNKAHVATAATTEMSLYTDGRMKTSGRNQTMIVP